MSTRSGKRIHSLLSENVESDLEIPIERKTRSKRVKEISDDVPTAKKKKNFVRLPFDDEVESLNDKTENIFKSVCKSRRQTLREINILSVDKEPLDDRKCMRQSRRLRKEEKDELTHVYVQENDKIGKEKKKKKKKAIIENLENDPVEGVILPKRKTSRKKRKSNSFIVEELGMGDHHKSFNKSNISIDSFHSAAGSPGKDNFNIEIINDDKIAKNKDRKTSNSLISFSENVKDTKKKSKKTEKDNHFETSSNMFVKLSASNESFESNAYKMGEIENKEGSKLEKEIFLTLKTKSKKNKSKQPKLLSDVGNTQTKAELTNSVEHNHSFEVNQGTDLNSSIKTKLITNIHKMKTSTSNVDFINSPHVNGTTNSIESFSLNDSSKKRKNTTPKNSISDNVDTSITLLNEGTTAISDNLLIGPVTINYTTDSQNIRKSYSKDSTYEKINFSDTNRDQNFDKSNNSFNKNYNADKELSRRESGIKNTTYDKIEENILDMDSMISKEPSNNYIEKTSVRSSKVSLSQDEVPTILNGTYDKISTDDSISFSNNTYDKSKLNNTFEKSNNALDGDNITNLDSKSPITSSDNTDNMTSDMSEDCSRISITSDDSRTDNIVNTTPLLIESSMDESEINSASILNKTATPQKEQAIPKINTPEKQTSLSENTKTPLKREGTFTETKVTPLKRDDKDPELRKSSSKRRTTITEYPRDSELPTTTLKREGTFTKESPDVRSSKSKSVDRTPTRRESMPSPGRTPFASSRSGSKGRVALNVTHSIEKPHGRSSAAAAPPRLTRVMFRSPVDDPVAVAQMKGKVIKSNLKGSNKSFMFDESVSEQGAGSRKRSRTHCEADEGAPRAHARAASAAARLQAPATPPVSKADAKLRTRLPDFAALHRRQFSKMESLDECQRRRARRARALLTPTKTTTTTTTTAHNVTTDTAQQQAAKRPAAAQSKEIDKKNSTQSYTRFGFKLNLDVNPFSVPAKTAEINPKMLKRQATLPSLAGTTLRKEVAKQTVMREKSFTDKRDVDRNQNRTVIKGVRTNRRFELQMKMRNIN